MAQAFYIMAALYAISPDLISAGVAAWYSSYYGREAQSHQQDERLFRAVEKAENQMQDNTIEFPDCLNDEDCGKNFHTDSFVVKAFLGEEINLTCIPDFPIGYSAAGFVDQLSWSHNGLPIKRNITMDGPRFKQINNSEHSILHIHPVTHRSAGRFDCMQRCMEDPIILCLRRTYALHAVPKGIHDVFLEPMQRLPTSNATVLSFSCTLQTECFPSSDPYFIWKYGGMFIASPEGHFLHRVARLQKYYELGVDWDIKQYNHSESNQHAHRDCFETITLTILRPDYRRGPIECWARTDRAMEKWFVQTKYVY